MAENYVYLNNFSNKLVAEKVTSNGKTVAKISVPVLINGIETVVMLTAWKNKSGEYAGKVGIFPATRWVDPTDHEQGRENVPDLVNISLSTKSEHQVSMPAEALDQLGIDYQPEDNHSGWVNVVMSASELYEYSEAKREVYRQQRAVAIADDGTEIEAPKKRSRK